MPEALHGTTRVQRLASVLVAQVNDQMVLMHPGHGNYYGLNAVGASVWCCLEQEIQVADLCALLAKEYDADVETIERDVLPLLEQLIEEELIEFRV